MRLLRRNRRMLHQLMLSPGTRAPAIARRKLLRALRGLQRDVVDDVLLLTTELVTNSVRHSRTDAADLICIEIGVEEDCVHVQVTDPGRGTRFGPQRLSPMETGGRGLVLVSELADRWGVERSQATSVWFELDLEPSPLTVG
jgi:anti-sigma regulatory factor (Ser/Thr protein kinase)